MRPIYFEKRRKHCEKRQQKHIMKRDNMSDADNASDCTK